MELFNILDSDRDGLLSISEFVDGCMKLKGFARAVDVEKLCRDNKLSRVMLAELEEMILHVHTGLSNLHKDFRKLADSSCEQKAFRKGAMSSSEHKDFKHLEVCSENSTEYRLEL
eukprot:TRINITY_DN14481_c1_g1_i1.p2 TRINITY_DN14481_c1_g1~~TRINITY_DN14481_c1_g1_i1.p2  ORF type:complete len:115 (+),score=21.24 TRINITY_DN14481_c1_g1_i1:637-981(+)